VIDIQKSNPPDLDLNYEYTITCSRVKCGVALHTSLHLLPSSNSPTFFISPSYHIKMTSRKRSSDPGAGPDDNARSKKVKVNSASKTDSNGDRYWEISKMRRVTISSFRGKTQVNVREYYEKDGQDLPGKKVSEQ